MSEATEKLVILHTNDIHSFFEQMPQIKTVLDTAKSFHAKHEVLTVDCGDHMDRMRMETEGSSGLANVEILNACGYDFIVPGNNEGLTYTAEVLAQTYAHARSSIVCGNMLEASTLKPPAWMTPFQIVQKGRLSVGVIGVTAYYPDFYRLLDWEVLDPFEVTNQLVDQLRPQVDILIVLSHLGWANDERMARELEGIDLIIGGHTHHLLEHPVRVNRTYIAAAGKFGQYVGQIVLHYDFASRSIVSLSGECIDVSSYPASPLIEDMIERYRRIGKQRLEHPVAHLNQPLFIDWHRESSLGNLLAAGLKKWVGADIGIVNAGQILDGLEAGAVTPETLLNICPSPINPCRLLLTGEKIRLAIEEALLEQFIENPIRGFGFRGKVLGTLCVEGLQIEYDSTRGAYEKVLDVRIGGESMQPNRTYIVGTIDMFTFGIGYSSLGKGSGTQYFLPEFLRDVLREQLRQPEEIEKSKRKRWHDKGD